MHFYFLEKIFYFSARFARHLIEFAQKVKKYKMWMKILYLKMAVKYSDPRLNGQRLSSHFLAVKAGWPFIRAN